MPDYSTLMPRGHGRKRLLKNPLQRQSVLFIGARMTNLNHIIPVYEETVSYRI